MSSSDGSDCFFFDLVSFRYLLAIRLYSQYAKESAQNESDISQKGGQEPRILIAGKNTLGSSFLIALNCSEGGDGL